MFLLPVSADQALYAGLIGFNLLGLAYNRAAVTRAFRARYPTLKPVNIAWGAHLGGTVGGLAMSRGASLEDKQLSWARVRQ